MVDEVLSQSEIDLLLSALTSGEIDTEEIRREAEQVKAKSYDFRRPNKFSKDQLRTIHLIHENFARLASNFLSVYLRTNIQMKIASVEQITFEDFIVSIPAPTVMAVVNMDPLPGSAVFETNPNFVFPIIDLLFGGPGLMPRQVREVTDIEAGVLKHLYNRVMENLTYAWSEVTELNPSIQSLETNPQLNRIISPNEIVAVVTFTTTIGTSEGMINLCLPYLTLEPVVSKLSSRYWYATTEREVEGQEQLILDVLNQTPLELVVSGGETELSVRDILELEVGDVLPLDNKAAQDLVMMVGGVPKFTVQPGIFGNHLAVQVTGYLERGEKRHE